MKRPGKSAAILLSVGAVLLLSGSSGRHIGWILNWMAPDEVRNGKSYFKELRQRQVDQILQSFDPSADKDQLRNQLGKVFALVPQEEPVGVETLGASTECKVSGVCTKLIILEYKYPDHWIVFRVTVSNQSGHDAITDLTVQPESLPLASMSRFTLRGAGLLHYVILLMALLSVGLAIYTLVLCSRTPIQKQKWLWFIVIILGIGEFGIEWTSGGLWYKILHLSILPGGWGFDSENPFVFTSIPAGAILFLLLRNRLLRTGAPALPNSDAEPVISASQVEIDSHQ